MSEPLLQKGLALLKAATTLDAQGHAQEAITQYLLALEVLVKVHGYEKLETNKALLKEKIELYMARVEQLRGGPASHTAAAPVASAPPAPELRLPEVPTGAPQHARGPGVLPAIVALAPKTVSIKLNETGHTYHTLFAAYLRGAVRVVVEDPYLKSPHQLRNLLRFLELVAEVNDAYEVQLVTRPDGEEQASAFAEMQRSLQELLLTLRGSDSLHDRCLRLSNGWRIVLGRGLDLWQKPTIPGSRYFIGASSFALRPTLECDVIYLKEELQ